MLVSLRVGFMSKQSIALLLTLLMLFIPLTGSIGESSVREGWYSLDAEGKHWAQDGSSFSSPVFIEEKTQDTDWWERTALDQNRNKIHDSLEDETGLVWIGLSFSSEVSDYHLTQIELLGLNIVDVIEAVDAVLLGQISVEYIEKLLLINDLVMVEEYGSVVFWGDVQTQAVKARSNSIYPNGAWDLGVSGEGVVVAMVDTGVDNEHPGLNQKFVAGYDAVCYLHTDPSCVAAGLGARETDGTYDPDDGHQHGTACMGMAAATGLDASGQQTEFYGSAPNSSLVDVRIGTDLGAGPFENYVIEQEFYESAMNGLQWIIDHKDDAWQGADESVHGIDIISLSWGITSHETGGSDGQDMHSRILDEATQAGLVVSVAAGNDGPDNDGLSGMGSSSLSITVGATDDINTVDRDDDTIASYSSRGPRRDNGDTNPLNELKPEVTAPGTNIIQAEGCVTSGGCSNLINDASENGYTGRGSGTSYATPSVTGIIALMLEANPDLSPLEIREILKITAERRGEASAPDVDPFWNRDFGWGMVDARAAVEMAIQMRDDGVTGMIDVSAQVHATSSGLNNQTGLFEVSGLVWSQDQGIASVEYRVDGGEWMSVSQEFGMEMQAFERWNWSLAIDSEAFSEGNHTIEIRATSAMGDMYSLSDSVIFYSSGLGSQDESSGLGIDIYLAGLILFALISGLMVFIRTRSEEPIQMVSDSKYSNLPKSLPDDELSIDELIDEVTLEAELID